jgi:hypothetical protein
MKKVEKSQISCNKKLREIVFQGLGRTIYEIANKRLGCSETNIKRLITKQNATMNKDLWNLAITLYVFDKHKNQRLSYQSIEAFNKIIGPAPVSLRYITSDEVTEVLAHIVLNDLDSKQQNIYILNLKEKKLDLNWKPDPAVLFIYRNMKITQLITFSPDSDQPPQLYSIDDEVIKISNAQKIANEYCADDILEALKIKLKEAGL